MVPIDWAREAHLRGAYTCAATLPGPGHCWNCAAVVVEGVTVTTLKTGAPIMLAFGIILNTIGIGLSAGLALLAVYAFPSFVESAAA
jgi:hypothetical protein